jgi:hypothetical protein
MRQDLMSTRVTTDPSHPIYFQQAVQTSMRLSGNIIRAGINYHLDW